MSGVFRCRSAPWTLSCLLLVAAAACGREKAAPRRPATLPVIDTTTIDSGVPDTTADTVGQSLTATVHVVDTTRVRSAGLEQIGRLSPLADSIANSMTFMATFQSTFLAASRAKHLLLDIGRVDARLTGRGRAAAYQQAVKLLSPVKVGDRFRLHGPWGTDSAVVTGYGSWNGRIVARLAVPPNVDSLAGLKAPLVAIAQRVDTTHADTAHAADSAAHTDTAAQADSAQADSADRATVDTCAYREHVDSAQLARAVVVRDSLMAILQADTAHLPPALLKGRKLTSSQMYGCFGAAHVLLFANWGAAANTYTREFAVLIDTTGRVVPLRVSDTRFHIHEALRALDVDGDGVDDVAAIGRGERLGGTVVLRLDPAKRRLTYVMSGFSWESY